MADYPNQVAWVGSDGNLWWRQGDQVINAGSASKYEFTNGGIRALDFDTPLGQASGFAPGVDQISDPNAPQRAPSGGGTAKPAFNQAAADNTQRAIDQLPGLLQAALEAEGTRYGNTVSELGAQESGQRKTYDTSTTTNQQNYDANFMDSIRSGIKGLGGVMNILRGTGAGGGSVEDIARDTVGGVTSNDIRMGADTQKENQLALDTSLGSFLTELGRKRLLNEDTRVNNERAIRRDTDTQMQDLLGKMAGYYSEAGRTADSDRLMRQAGDLTPGIAANSRTAISPYDTTPVAVQAPQLTAFAGPTQPNFLPAPSDGQVGSGIFTMSDRRRKEPAAAGA